MRFSHHHRKLYIDRLSSRATYIKKNVMYNFFKDYLSIFDLVLYSFIVIIIEKIKSPYKMEGLL